MPFVLILTIYSVVPKNAETVCQLCLYSAWRISQHWTMLMNALFTVRNIDRTTYYISITKLYIK